MEAYVSACSGKMQTYSNAEDLYTIVSESANNVETQIRGYYENQLMQALAVRAKHSYAADGADGVGGHESDEYD